MIPRRIGDFLAWRWRTLPYAMAALDTATFVARAIDAGSRHEIVVPSGMALAAVAFLFLYEVRIRDLVAAPIVPPDHASARRVLVRRFS